MSSEILTTKQLKERRKLAIQELLNVYQMEHLDLLKELGRRYRRLKSPSVNDLSEVQKLLVLAKYNDFLDSSFQTQSRTVSELAELKRLDIPVLSGVKMVCGETGMLSFSQAEAFLVSQTVNTKRSSSRLSPHLSTSSPQLTELVNPPTETADHKPLQSALVDRMQEVHRLEEICCTASSRQMDRQDCLATLICESGRFLIRQSSFTIGRSSLNPSTPSTIDVNLSKKDTTISQHEIFAFVWMKADGTFHIRCIGENEIIVDGYKVESGKIAVLHQWSLLEIDKVHLMIVMNKSSALRVKKRSREAMNV